MEYCGRVARRLIQNRDFSKLAGSTPAKSKCCILQQDILSTLLSTGFYPMRHAHNTKNIRLSQ